MLGELEGCTCLGLHHSALSCATDLVGDVVAHTLERAILGLKLLLSRKLGCNLDLKGLQLYKIRKRPTRID